jgi:hypothetical protein
MALVSLKIYPQVDHKAGVNYFQGELFQSGFSAAEKEWRWTDGTEAVLLYPLEAVDPAHPYTLELVAGASGSQPVELEVNGAPIGRLTFIGFTPQTQTLSLSGALLKANNPNTIHFLIPNASPPPGDSRRLGLAFVSLKIYSNQSKPTGNK